MSCPASDIIDRLGGTGAVARGLDIQPSVVSMWRARDTIPGRWHLQLMRLARERGVDLPDDDLMPTR